jgi:hypothetical protein
MFSFASYQQSIFSSPNLGFSAISDTSGPFHSQRASRIDLWEDHHDLVDSRDNQLHLLSFHDPPMGQRTHVGVISIHPSLDVSHVLLLDYSELRYLEEHQVRTQAESFD